MMTNLKQAEISSTPPVVWHCAPTNRIFYPRL